MTLPAIDTAFFILLGLLTLRGFLKGFTGELFSIASLALGLIAAVFFFKPGGVFLRSRYFQNLSLIPEILAFTGIFLVVFIAGKIIERIVKDIITGLHLEKLDKALGLILGLAEALALISVTLLIIMIQPFFEPLPLLGESLFARFMVPLLGGFGV
ncbi:MAG: CvpA family protein [Spirochaetaceae bacterium]|nr:CvpA family protein [Spirochaetaceae bacterium]